jgi:hypothetical protein
MDCALHNGGHRSLPEYEQELPRLLADELLGVHVFENVYGVARDQDLVSLEHAGGSYDMTGSGAFCRTPDRCRSDGLARFPSCERVTSMKATHGSNPLAG